MFSLKNLARKELRVKIKETYLEGCGWVNWIVGGGAIISDGVEDSP